MHNWVESLNMKLELLTTHLIVITNCIGERVCVRRHCMVWALHLFTSENRFTYDNLDNNYEN